MGFKELSMRAMELALRTTQYPKEDAPCIFVEYSGNVKWLEIRMYEHGWKTEVSAEVNVIAHADRNNNEFVQNTLDYVEKVLDEYEGRNK